MSNSPEPIKEDFFSSSTNELELEALKSKKMLRPILSDVETAKQESAEAVSETKAETGVATTRLIQPQEPTPQEIKIESRELDLAPPKPAANKRKIHYTLRNVVIFLTVVAIIFGSLNWWFYINIKEETETRLAEIEERLSKLSGAPTSITPSAIPVTSEKLVSADELHRAEEALKANNEQTQTQVLAALRRITELEARTKQSGWDLEELNKTTTLVKKDLDGLLEKSKAIVVAAPAPVPAPVVADTGAERAPVTPSQAELVLLKERNRLTELADDAIATGNRAPYTRLWEAFDDPRLSPLLHAARAEILRVQNFYLSGSRLQKFDIPVAELFPQTPTLRDTQLSDDQIIGLLGDNTKDWPIRMKSAWILGQRRSTRSGEALVKAIQEDPNLDVVKEATFSFEQMTGFRAKIFEPKLIEEFWKNFNAKQPPKEADAAQETKQPKKEDAKKSESKKKS
jgi:hypothetical protein